MAISWLNKAIKGIGRQVGGLYAQVNLWDDGLDYSKRLKQYEEDKKKFSASVGDLNVKSTRKPDTRTPYTPRASGIEGDPFEVADTFKPKGVSDFLIKDPLGKLTVWTTTPDKLKATLTKYKGVSNTFIRNEYFADIMEAARTGDQAAIRTIAAVKDDILTGDIRQQYSDYALSGLERGPGKVARLGLRGLGFLEQGVASIIAPGNKNKARQLADAIDRSKNPRLGGISQASQFGGIHGRIASGVLDIVGAAATGGATQAAKVKYAPKLLQAINTSKKASPLTKKVATKLAGGKGVVSRIIGEEVYFGLKDLTNDELNLVENLLFGAGIESLIAGPPVVRRLLRKFKDVDSAQLKEGFQEALNRVKADQRGEASFAPLGKDEPTFKDTEDEYIAKVNKAQKKLGEPALSKKEEEDLRKKFRRQKEELRRKEATKKWWADKAKRRKKLTSEEKARVIKRKIGEREKRQKAFEDKKHPPKWEPPKRELPDESKVDKAAEKKALDRIVETRRISEEELSDLEDPTAQWRSLTPKELAERRKEDIIKRTARKVSPKPKPRSVARPKKQPEKKPPLITEPSVRPEMKISKSDISSIPKGKVPTGKAIASRNKNYTFELSQQRGNLGKEEPTVIKVNRTGPRTYAADVYLDRYNDTLYIGRGKDGKAGLFGAHFSRQKGTFERKDFPKYNYKFSRTRMRKPGGLKGFNPDTAVDGYKTADKGRMTRFSPTKQNPKDYDYNMDRIHILEGEGPYKIIIESRFNVNKQGKFKPRSGNQGSVRIYDSIEEILADIGSTQHGHIPRLQRFKTAINDWLKSRGEPTVESYTIPLRQEAPEELVKAVYSTPGLGPLVKAEIDRLNALPSKPKTKPKASQISDKEFERIDEEAKQNYGAGDEKGFKSPEPEPHPVKQAKADADVDEMKSEFEPRENLTEAEKQKLARKFEESDPNEPNVFGQDLEVQDLMGKPEKVERPRATRRTLRKTELDEGQKTLRREQEKLTEPDISFSTAFKNAVLSISENRANFDFAYEEIKKLRRMSDSTYLNVEHQANVAALNMLSGVELRKMNKVDSEYQRMKTVQSETKRWLDDDATQNTDRTFENVFGDEESIGNLGAMDSTLNQISTNYKDWWTAKPDKSTRQGSVIGETAEGEAVSTRQDEGVSHNRRDLAREFFRTDLTNRAKEFNRINKKQLNIKKIIAKFNKAKILEDIEAGAKKLGFLTPEASIMRGEKPGLDAVAKARSRYKRFVAAEITLKSTTTRFRQFWNTLGGTFQGALLTGPKTVMISAAGSMINAASTYTARQMLNVLVDQAFRKYSKSATPTHRRHFLNSRREMKRDMQTLLQKKPLKRQLFQLFKDIKNRTVNVPELSAGGKFAHEVGNITTKSYLAEFIMGGGYKSQEVVDAPARMFAAINARRQQKKQFLNKYGKEIKAYLGDKKWKLYDRVENDLQGEIGVGRAARRLWDKVADFVASKEGYKTPEAQKRFRDELTAQVKDEANEVALAGQTRANEVISNIFRGHGPEIEGIGRIIAPFRRFASYFATKTVRMTPLLGQWNKVYRDNHLKKLLDDGVIDQATFDNRAFDLRVENATNQIMGASLLLGGYFGIAHGILDMDTEYPKDNRERDAWRRVGRRPFNLRIGGATYDLSSLSQYGGLLTLGAAIRKGGEVDEDQFITAVIELLRIHGDHPLVNNIAGDFAKSFDNPYKSPQDSLYQMSTELLSGFMPNAVKQTARVFDTGTKQPDDFVDAVITQYLPGVSKSVPNRVDALGEDVYRDPLAQLINPFNPQGGRGGDDPLFKELGRLYEKGVAPADISFKPSSLPEEMQEQLDDVKIPKSRFTAVSNAIRKEFAEKSRQVIQQQGYKDADDKGKRKILNRVKQDIYNYHRNNFLSRHGVETEPIKYGPNTFEEVLEKDYTEVPRSQVSAELNRIEEEIYDMKPEGREWRVKIAARNRLLDREIEAVQDELSETTNAFEKEDLRNKINKLGIQKRFTPKTVDMYHRGSNKEVLASVLNAMPGKSAMNLFLLMVEYGDELVARGGYSRNKFRNSKGRLIYPEGWTYADKWRTSSEKKTTVQRYRSPWRPKAVSLPSQRRIDYDRYRRSI